MRQQLLEICEAFATRRNFSGSCLVKRGNEIILAFVCGLAHAGFAVPNRLDTRFNTASATKVFTAVAAVMMIERGAFTFHDTITDLIDLKGTSIPDDVTIEHLLTHTSGIDDDADDDDSEAYDEMFRKTPNYMLRNTVDFLPLFAYKQPLFQAGTAIRYNNCAYILLGLAIEKYSGKNYRSFVMENIVRPLALQNTAFLSFDDVAENVAEGYYMLRSSSSSTAERKKNIYSFPPVGTPDAGIYTTVEDMDTFFRAIKDERLLSTEYSEAMLHPHSSFLSQTAFGTDRLIEERTGYAFHFVEKESKTFCIYKDGWWPGVGAIMSYYPESDITNMILTNHTCNIWEMHRQMEQVLFPESGITPYR